jgi:hypothetical protein
MVPASVIHRVLRRVVSSAGELPFPRRHRSQGTIDGVRRGPTAWITNRREVSSINPVLQRSCDQVGGLARYGGVQRGGVWVRCQPSTSRKDRWSGAGGLGLVPGLGYRCEAKTILRRKEWQPCLRDWWRGNAVYDDRHEPAGTAPGRNSLGFKGLNAFYTFRIGAHLFRLPKLREAPRRRVALGSPRHTT